MHRVGVRGQVDVDPAFGCAELRVLGHWAFVEVDAVEVQKPGRLSTSISFRVV